MTAYAGAAELDPEDAVYHNNAGRALYDLGRYEEALTTFTRAAELAPENAVYHYNAGRALYDLERYQEALTAYDRAAELAPENADYHNNGGASPYRTGTLRRRADRLCPGGGAGPGERGLPLQRGKGAVRPGALPGGADRL